MGEGRGDLPARTVTVYNILNIEVKAAKLFKFTLNLSGNDLVWHVIVHGTYCYHGKHILTETFFQIWNFPDLKKENIYFFAMTFPFLNHVTAFFYWF